MVANWLQSPQSAFDNAVGILLGSGHHWTSLLLRDRKMLHFDSLSQAAMLVTDLAHFARRTVFRITSGAKHDEFYDEAHRMRAEYLHALEWEGQMGA